MCPVNGENKKYWQYNIIKSLGLMLFWNVGITEMRNCIL